MWENIKFKEVPFEIMLKCDGEIKCNHWLLNNSYKTGGIDLTQPMLFNDFIKQIGTYLTSFNCKSLLTQARWYIIDDGVQPDFFIKN
jgi:hypothetical protein